ncbi:MAG: hypothetical protein V4617_07630 [Gemmatimonadota bacterium]
MTTQMQPPDAEHSPNAKPDTLNVIVRYAAAPKPFHDTGASRDETLAALKVRVLNTFGLSEGPSALDGNAITYKLYDGKTELTDLTVTLGTLAEKGRAVELKLSQHIQQGVGEPTS